MEAMQALIKSLSLLCEREGGRAVVAATIGYNEQSLYQVIAGVRRAGGRPRTIGARMQRLLDQHYPGWHELAAHAERDGGEPAIYVPLLDNAASMGDGTEALPDDAIAGNLPVSPAWAKRHLSAIKTGALRFIHGQGDSMEPTFSDGDILLVDTSQRDAGSVDGIYVLRVYDRLYIKRVQRTFSGVLQVSSDNPTVKTVDVLDGTHPVDVLGRVVWLWNGHAV